MKRMLLLGRLLGQDQFTLPEPPYKKAPLDTVSRNVAQKSEVSFVVV